MTQTTDKAFEALAAASPACCCKRGQMCAACGTGRCTRCHDRDDQDDYERDDDAD